MNDKMAKRLRNVTGYHPSDDRNYVSTIKTETIAKIAAEMVAVAKAFGFETFPASSPLAEKLGLEPGPHHYQAMPGTTYVGRNSTRYAYHQVKKESGK
jgi:hypothetical protein